MARLSAKEIAAECDTLADLAAAFYNRVERSQRDFVVTHVIAADTLPEAIRRAVESKGVHGKHYNHQSKIPRIAYAPWLASLLKHQDAMLAAVSFDQLHDVVEAAAQGLHGIGALFIYDMSIRIANWREAHEGARLQLDSIYVHADVRTGLNNMGINTRGRKRIPMTELPSCLHQYDPDLMEDFICFNSKLIANYITK